MANRVVEILRAHCEHWRSIIPMLEDGRIGTHEIREGQRVDTTEETILENRRLLEETEALIAKIEATDA